MHVVLWMSPPRERGPATTWQPNIWDSLAHSYGLWPHPGECLCSSTEVWISNKDLSGDLVAVNAYKLGWQPKWDQERFLNSIDDEITAVQELDTVKPTLYESLLSPSK